MKLNIPKLFTPVYVKENDAFQWPENEKVFYLLTKDGCFLCRNHPFFRSSAKSENGFPTDELAAHKATLHLNYPKLSQAELERVVGFFKVIADKHNSEAAALMVCNKQTGEVEIVTPPQTVNSMSVHYDVPKLAPHLVLIGDIHSHVNMAAFASGTDTNDETHRPGLHIVVGKIDEEPPEFYADAVVDGQRFNIKDLTLVVEGYEERCDEAYVPQDWLDKVTYKPWVPYYPNHSYSPQTKSEKRWYKRFWKRQERIGGGVYD